MSVLIFLLVLFVLVLVHEWGHFIVAKKTGMRVDEFGIGFPPKVFGWKKGETEYTFNLLPIGGFVKIHGEDSIGVEGVPDSDRSFTAKSKWAQAAVLIAGVTMNVLFAWLLFVIVLSMGTLTAVPEEDASDEARLIVTSVLADGPAQEAGIPRGAHILSLSREDELLAAPTPSSFRSFIEAGGEEPVTITYGAGASEVALETTLTPGRGVIDGEDRLAVGVALTLLEEISYPIHEALYRGGIQTLTSLRDITVGISGLLWDAVRLKADFSDVAGPVGIVGLVGEASAFGITSLMMFTAFISLNLAVINMLPFPALDGGRLLFVAIEAIKGSPIKASWVATLNTIGFLLLILLMVAVTYNDIVRII